MDKHIGEGSRHVFKPGKIKNVSQFSTATTTTQNKTNKTKQKPRRNGKSLLLGSPPLCLLAQRALFALMVPHHALTSVLALLPHPARPLRSLQGSTFLL